jgi:hypothetical protein
MAAGGGDLERPLGALLTFDVRKVGLIDGKPADRPLRPGQDLRAFDMIDELDERARRDHLHVARRPGGFRPAFAGTDQPQSARIGGDRRRQDARRRRQRSIEREFAKHDESFERVRGNGADGGHDAKGDRHVIVTSLFRHVGGGEIDRDALCRQRQSRCDQRGAHPFARFADSLVGKADDVENDGAARDLHLNVDWTGLDAFESDRRNPHRHRAPLKTLLQMSMRA